MTEQGQDLGGVSEALTLGTNTLVKINIILMQYLEKSKSMQKIHDA